MYHVTKSIYRYQCGLKRHNSSNYPVIWYWKEEDIWTYNGVQIEPPEDICPKCLYALDLMKIECAWCRKFLGYKEGKTSETSKQGQSL